MATATNPDISGGLRISSFYRPNAKQQLFHSSNAKYRAQIGGFGGGKTRGQLMEAIRYAMTVPGSDSLIIRRTHKDLQKTVINLLLNPTQGGLGVPLEDLGAHYNKVDHICYFDHANGVQSKIWFGYCDEGKDVNQYLSTEYVFVGIEEAGEFPFVVWKELTGRNRCPIKTDIFGNVVRPTAALVTNPFGIGYGWIKKLFIDKQAVGGMSNYDPSQYEMIHSTLFDNPVYASDTEYISTLEALPEAEKQKKLYGNLNQVSGQYYINFDPDPKHEGSHVVSYSKIQFQPWHPRWMGQDYGFAGEEAGGSSNVCLWMAKADVLRFGAIKTVNVIYREKAMWQKTETQTATEVKAAMDKGEQLANIFFSHEQFAKKNNPRSVADQYGDELIKFSLPRPTRSDSDREGGWKLAYNLFESGDLLIAGTCPQLIAAIPLWTRDPDHIEDILKTHTIEDDFADAFRYGLKGFLAPGNVPLEVVLDAKLVAAKSNTERFMIQQRFEQEHRGEEALAIKVPKRRFW